MNNAPGTYLLQAPGQSHIFRSRLVAVSLATPASVTRSQDFVLRQQVNGYTKDGKQSPEDVELGLRRCVSIGFFLYCFHLGRCIYNGKPK